MRGAIVALFLALSPAAMAADHTIVGLQLDAGAPDGLGASLILRPLSFLRFQAGATTDLVAPGVHVGLAISVPWYISPVISAEVGHQFAGDVNKLLVMAGVTGVQSQAVLERVDYDYGNLHAGLEFGAPNRFMITVHAGYSIVRTETNGLSMTLAAQDPSLSAKEGRLQVIAPSAKVGLLIYLF